MEQTNNMQLWDEFKETPPGVTKAFTKGGGFKGKAIDPMYIIRRLTEKFGPIGTGWGYEIIDEAYVNGAPFKKENGDGCTIIHKICLHIWYMSAVFNKAMERDVMTKFYTGQQFGLTTFVGEYKSGPFTDEDHAKKSVTDALGKCAVLLGLAADVHMGLHDDNKYVNDLREKLNKRVKVPSEPANQTDAGSNDDIPLGEPGSSGVKEYESPNKDLTDEERKAKGLISSKQRGRLKGKVDKQGWPVTAVSSLLAEHGYKSSHDIKWQDYKKIVEQIESLDMKKEQQDIPM